MWQHNSLTQSKIRGSTELISSSGIGSVSAGGGWWNSWANRSHIILLNSVASDHKQPYQSSRSYWTTSAPGCITSQEWDRKHKQNADKALPPFISLPWGSCSSKVLILKRNTSEIPLKCCVGASPKHNISLYFITWIFFAWRQQGSTRLSLRMGKEHVLLGQCLSCKSLHSETGAGSFIHRGNTCMNHHQNISVWVCVHSWQTSF